MKYLSAYRPAEMDSQKPRSISLHAYLARLIGLCVLPLAVLAVYLAFDHVRDLKDQRDRMAADQARNVVNAIDRDIGLRIAALQMMAASPLIDDPPRWDGFYKAALAFHQNFGGHVILADLSMQMILNTRVPLGEPLPGLPKPKGHAAVTMVLATGKPAVGDMFQGPVAKEPLVAVVAPIIRESRIIFLLVNSIEVRQFRQLLDELALPAGWTLTLRDGKDDVMARRSLPNQAGSPAAEDPHGVFIARSAVSPWSVILEVPRNALRGPVVAAAVMLAIVILAVTFVSILGGRLASRKLSRSVAALAKDPVPTGVHPVITEIETARTLLDASAAARDEAESIRQESETKYRLLAENASDVIWILDLDAMHFRYVSPSVERLRGFTVAEVLAQDFTVAITPDSLRYLQSVLSERIEKFRQGSIEYYKDEIDQPRKDGTIVSTEVTSRYLMNPATGHLEVVGVTRDISDRKTAEQALKASEQRLRMALQAAKAGTWEWDLRTNENFWSEELWELYGLDPHDSNPSYAVWKQAIHPDDRQVTEDAVQDAVRRGTELNAEWRVGGGGDGKECWLMSRGQPVKNADGQTVRYIGIVMDVTERNRTMEALRDSLDEKVALLKEVHHRVKNNLQIVASLLGLQASRSSSPEVVGALEDTRNRVKSMALLHEALYTAGNMACINFGDYVRNLCGQLFLSFGPAAGRITLENRLMDVGLPLENAVSCGLIVNELVSNALKHAFPGERTGRVTVSLEPAEGRMLVLSVCDDGVGLPSGLDPAATPTLGLQLVSILSSQILGQLEAVPFHGAGAAFRVKFPAPENTF